MTTEYWLQKKTIGGWSMVTWYAELEQAQRNYDSLRKGVGFSYRLVEVKTVQEHLLEEVTPIEAPEVEQTAKANVWGGQKKSNGVNEQINTMMGGWGSNTSLKPTKNDAWGNNTPVNFGDVQQHGMTGKIWLVHHGLKEKKRVDPSAVDAMMKDGWERGGPKTVFRT